MMNMRLVRPGCLVDINGVPGLDDIREDDGQIAVGALTRYSTIEWSPTIGARLPLLAELVRYVGDRQIRTRGTIGGSLAHADPTGEMPLAVARSRREPSSAGRRRKPGDRRERVLPGPVRDRPRERRDGHGSRLPVRARGDRRLRGMHPAPRRLRGHERRRARRPGRRRHVELGTNRARWASRTRRSSPKGRQRSRRAPASRPRSCRRSGWRARRPPTRTRTSAPPPSTGAT